MTVHELTPEQLRQLKEYYYVKAQEAKGQGVSYGELAQINEFVSDAEIIEHFEGVEFVPNDFWSERP